MATHEQSHLIQPYITPMGYQYQIEDEGMTEKETSLPIYAPSIHDIVAEVKAGLEEELPSQIVEQFAKEGYSVTVDSVDVIEVWHTERSLKVYPINHVVFYRVHYRYKATITSDKPFKGSPIAGVILLIIKWIIRAIVIIIIAWFVIQALKDWLISMTTTKTTIRTHQPDCTWTEETTEKPDIMGMVVVLGVLLIGGLAVTRRKRKPKEEVTEEIV